MFILKVAGILLLSGIFIAGLLVGLEECDKEMHEAIQNSDESELDCWGW